MQMPPRMRAITAHILHINLLLLLFHITFTASISWKARKIAAITLG